MQDCSNSSALAVELLQPCTKPSYHKYKIINRQRNIEKACLLLLSVLWLLMTMHHMMTSLNENMCYWLLWGETTDHQWIPLTKASDVELWCCLLICASKNSWANNQDAGDLGHHHTHYDVTMTGTMMTGVFVASHVCAVQTQRTECCSSEQVWENTY